MTFVTDEIEIMRSLGEKIHIFSVRKPSEKAYSSLQSKFLLETRYILPLNLICFIFRLTTVFLNKPTKVVSTFFRLAFNSSLTFKNRMRTLIHFFEALYFYKDFKDCGARHLHIHCLSGGATIALVLHQIFGISYSLTAHGTDIFVEKVLLKEKISPATFTRVGTNYNAKYLQSFFAPGFPPRIAVLPFGIDLDKYAGSPQPNQEIPVKIKILNVGRLVWQKAQHLLVEAAAGLRKQGLSFEITIIGDGPEREKLNQLINHYSLSTQVILLGKQDEEKVREAYTSAHFFVLSSVSEGFGLVLIEAIASGIPVIAPKLRGIPEIVTDNINGLLFTPGDAADLAEKILFLAKNHNDRIRLGKAARAKALTYDNRKIIAQFRDTLYRAALS
jgi:glycosyltransferase involved in cell wall biosynthesis